LDNTPIEEVANLLERWYGVDVTLVGEELKKYRFTTTFENESLFQVLELMELSSPIDIKYFPGKIDRNSGNAERSRVTISKKQI
jgi:ferric-dicitrate binding protein FerR (iron transport regulator)